MELHTYSDFVKLLKSYVECPICKEPCKEPIRPKGCAHRYCTQCFKQCFKEKSKKQCATCRTPILAVTQRGYTQDELFQKIGESVPGLDDDDDDEYDLAAMMAKQQQHSAQLRQAALRQRELQGDEQWAQRAPPRPTRASAPSQVLPERDSIAPDDPRKMPRSGSLGPQRSGKLSREDSADMAWPSRSATDDADEPGREGSLKRPPSGNSMAPPPPPKKLKPAPSLPQAAPQRDVRRPDDDRPPSPHVSAVDAVRLLQASIAASRQPRPRVVQLCILPAKDGEAPRGRDAATAAVHIAAPWEMSLHQLMRDLQEMGKLEAVKTCRLRKSGVSDGLKLVDLAATTVGRAAELCGEHVILYVNVAGSS